MQSKSQRYQNLSPVRDNMEHNISNNNNNNNNNKNSNNNNNNNNNIISVNKN